MERLGAAGRLARSGGVQAVSGFAVPDPGAASLVLARAVWLLILSGRRIHQPVKGALTPVDALSTETTFQYKYTWAFCALTVALDGVLVIVVIGLIRSGQLTDAVFVTLICFGGISLIGWFVITSRADVVVSETGVSRRLWGRTLREISWGNIKKIRVFKMYDQAYRRKVRVFHVFPVRPSGFRLSPSGKIWFDEPEDLSALIEHMNRHIAAQRIPVEVQVGASWSDPASWSTRNRISPTPETPS